MLVRLDFREKVHIRRHPNALIATFLRFEMTAVTLGILSTCSMHQCIGEMPVSIMDCPKYLATQCCAETLSTDIPFFQ